ncbi:MAG TPA: pilus assembly protein TadG-related protein, partial [Caulobacteraceae bacterium]|nr:pilus assembly protein TadG-related protein [Caulobacteraceae bacterium]
MIRRILRAFAGRREGSVSVVTAVSLPILIAITGLVAEYGNGLLHKIEDQRIADAAAFAAATAYGASSSNSITSVTDSVATINGVPTSAISATLKNSPTGDGNQAVEVTVTTQTPLLLSKVLGNSQANLNITATSYAEIKGGAPGCIIALNSAGTGVSVSGGATVSAAACAVASDETVNCANSGNIITTIAVDWSTSAPVGCSGIQAPTGKTVSIKHAVTPDPLAGAAGVLAATARLSTVTSMSVPGAPTVSGGNPLNVNGSGPLSGLPTNCVDAGGTSHPITCTGNGPFVFGAITNHGGQSWSINMTGTSPEIDVNGQISFASGGT